MKKFIFIFSACGLLNGCANMVAPTGGDKDVLAPQLLSIDKKTNENVQSIYFEFDGKNYTFLYQPRTQHA